MRPSQMQSSHNWHVALVSSVIGAIFKMAGQGEQWMPCWFVNVDYEHPMSKASKGKNNKA